MFLMKQFKAIFLSLIISISATAQANEEYIKDSTIQTTMLFPYSNQMGLPIIKLNSSDQLELHFDDMNGGNKNYYYTYQLCNADWSTALLSYFDYVKGFSNNRISTFRVSSIAQKRYTHYEAFLPERNCTPIKSGNYILKVFLDGDTSKTVFTKRFMIYEEKASIGAQIVQPFNANFYQTHQRIMTKVNAQALNVANPHQQLKLVVLQNNRWDNAAKNIQPTFVRNKEIEYNTDNDFLFQAGREWRWVDLRTFRFWSDRVAKGEQFKGGNTIYVKPDAERVGLRYSFYRDLNGLFSIETTDNVNPYWQGDYAKVYFNYAPPNGIPYAHKEMFLISKFTNYGLHSNAKMTFNEIKKVYETSLDLKQGYYSYQYALTDLNDKQKTKQLTLTEGNYWEAENTYQVLVYYKALGARVDELVGYTNISSLNGRTGNGF
jgi:hypothetical protein